MMFPVVTELAADQIPVTVSCRVLKLCRQQYYRWLAEPVTDAELDEAYLANAVFDAAGVDCRHTSMHVVGHLNTADRHQRR